MNLELGSHSSSNRLGGIGFGIAIVAVTMNLVVLNDCYSQSESQDRVSRGLVALYDFSEQKGDVVYDRSGVGRPLNLRATTPKNIVIGAGAAEFKQTGILKSIGTAEKVQNAIKQTGEITLELWLQASNLKQSGPARILTISKNSSERNVTLGQDGDKIEVRLRTTQTSTNGIPSMASKDRSLTTKLAHVVYCHNRNGVTKLFINGKINSQADIAGNTSNWSQGFQLAFGDEISGGRPWLGKIFLAAIYSRSLSGKEIKHNFDAGHNAKQGAEVVAVNPKAQFFEQKIAPLLSKHCLECHDSSNQKGELDLSSKHAVFKRDGKDDIIKRGNSGESYLFELVMDDDMPADRKPLTAKEKYVLKNGSMTARIGHLIK